MRKIFVAIAAFAALSLAQEAVVDPAANNITAVETAPAQPESVALNGTEVAPVIPAETVEAAPVETEEAPVAAETTEESAAAADEGVTIPSVVVPTSIVEAVEAEAAAIGGDIESAENESYTLGGSIDGQSANVQVSLGQLELNSAQNVMVPTVLVAVAGFALLQ